MSGGGQAEPTLAELRRRLRASAVLDVAQKRAWRAVLPHMAAAHRRELWAILEMEVEDEGEGARFGDRSA